MLFQVRTDNHIKNNDDLAGRIQADVESALHPRFADRLRRVEVYLQDTNGPKGGPDTRCSIEAHLAGHQPVAVHSIAGSVDEAVSAAVEKLLHALEHTLGRLGDRNGQVSMSGEE